MILLAQMPYKCAVFGCISGYLSSQTRPLFHFPNDQHKALQEMWIKFLNRKDYTVTPQSCICIDHFEEKFVVRHDKRQRLVPFPQNPIPTIHPDTIPLSQAITPALPRQAPKKLNF